MLHLKKLHVVDLNDDGNDNDGYDGVIVFRRQYLIGSGYFAFVDVMMRVPLVECCYGFQCGMLFYYMIWCR